MSFTINVRNADGRFNKVSRRALHNSEYDKVGDKYRIYYIYEIFYLSPDGYHRKGRPADYSKWIVAMLDEQKFEYEFGEDSKGKYIEIEDSSYDFLQYELYRK